VILSRHCKTDTPTSRAVKGRLSPPFRANGVTYTQTTADNLQQGVNTDAGQPQQPANLSKMRPRQEIPLGIYTMRYMDVKYPRTNFRVEIRQTVYAIDSPAEARLGDDGLDPVEEVAVLRLLPAELVVDQLDLDGLRHAGSTGGKNHIPLIGDNVALSYLTSQASEHVTGHTLSASWQVVSTDCSGEVSLLTELFSSFRTTE